MRAIAEIKRSTSAKVAKLIIILRILAKLTATGLGPRLLGIFMVSKGLGRGPMELGEMAE